MELRMDDSFNRKRVDVGRADIAAIYAEVGVAEVVGNDQQDIRAVITLPLRRACTNREEADRKYVPTADRTHTDPCNLVRRGASGRR
jgi:hypothetical protein